MQFISVSFLQNAMCVELFSLILDIVFNIINVYDPCVANEVYWESFLNCLDVRRNNIILASNMNFILRQGEVWEVASKIDRLARFLSRN